MEGMNVRKFVLGLLLCVEMSLEHSGCLLVVGPGATVSTREHTSTARLRVDERQSAGFCG